MNKKFSGFIVSWWCPHNFSFSFQNSYIQKNKNKNNFNFQSWMPLNWFEKNLWYSFQIQLYKYFQIIIINIFYWNILLLLKNCRSDNYSTLKYFFQTFKQLGLIWHGLYLFFKISKNPHCGYILFLVPLYDFTFWNFNTMFLERFIKCSSIDCANFIKFWLLSPSCR